LHSWLWVAGQARDDSEFVARSIFHDMLIYRSRAGRDWSFADQLRENNNVHANSFSLSNPQDYNE
jgi:hypothetical protein